MRWRAQGGVAQAWRGVRENLGGRTAERQQAVAKATQPLVGRVQGHGLPALAVRADTVKAPGGLRLQAGVMVEDRQQPTHHEQAHGDLGVRPGRAAL